MNIIIKISICIFVLCNSGVFAQSYEIIQDNDGKYFPKINGKFQKNIKVSRNKIGKKALVVNNKPVTPYKYDVIFHDDWKKMVIVYIGDTSIKYGGPKDGFGKYGLIDKMGKEIVPTIYDVIWNEIQGAILYQGIIEDEFPVDGLWGYVGINSNIFIPCTLQYNKVEFFKNKHAKVLKGKYISDEYGNKKIDGHVGFIDTTGKEVVKCNISTSKYNYIYNPSEGLIGVGKIIKPGSETEAEITKFGFINYDGDIVIPLIWDKIDAFKYGICKVYSDDRKICGCKGEYVNKKGEKINPEKTLLNKYWGND